MIKKQGGGYVVLSSKGKRLSRVYQSRDAAVHRLKQVEFFKHQKK